MPLPPGVAAALKRQAEALTRELQAFAALDAAHGEHLRAAEAAVTGAFRDLAAAALPSLEDEAALASAARCLHLSAFEPDAVRASVDERRRTLAAALASVSEDPRLPTAAARVTALEERSRELAEPVSHLRTSVQALEQDRDLQEYFACLDDGRWWTFSFHRARAAGQRAFERHGERRGVSDPRALVKRHRQEQEALATLTGELRAAAEERTALLALRDEHERLRRELSDVEVSVLGQLREGFVRAVRALDDKALLSLFDAPPLRVHARRISGGRARQRYLEGLYAHHGDRTRGELVSHLQDVDLVLREGARAGRRGAGDSEAEVEADTRRRLRDLADRRGLYHATAERLLAFSRWDEHDPLAGGLWWDAFTGGLLNGSFLDEVAWHHTMGRPAAERGLSGGADRRDVWARNALNAMDALSEAHAAVLAGKADEDDAAGVAVPAPVDLGDDDE